MTVLTDENVQQHLTAQNRFGIRIKLQAGFCTLIKFLFERNLRYHLWTGKRTQDNRRLKIISGSGVFDLK